MDYFKDARRLIFQFKGDNYRFGRDVLSKAGQMVAGIGTHVALVYSSFPGSEKYVDIIRDALKARNLQIVNEIPGAQPNAPREDLFRITDSLQQVDYDVLISFGGGSTIDAAKAADVLVRLGEEIDDYFGTGLVTKALDESGKSLTPHLAIQTIASSGAHLTKYSNITDISTGQKKLIVDEAIVPSLALFDYGVTEGAPPSLTMDGALDGVSHSLEVLYGAVKSPNYQQIETIATTSIALVVNHLPKALENLKDVESRDALCLATDLGGYAIMVGGTNGGHLTSFSLVDILSHGRACAMLNPYYTVFFAPAIEQPLRSIGTIYQDAGFISKDLTALQGNELGLAVAEGMFAFAEVIGFPTYLEQVQGFSQTHIERALNAAKNPQLKMKLENMPIPFSEDMIDEYMGPILQSAASGDLSIIKRSEMQ